MSGIVEQFMKFGAARLAAMLAVTLALVGFFGFVMLKVSQPQMSVLFSDLSSTDVNAILKDLDARGVKYELRGDGQTVLVDKAAVPRLRLDLAGKGIPAGGGVGYEIFDKGDAFSSTSFVQNINHLRALEGELSRTIRSISRVQSARVHLVIPEKRLFERDREAPRASIALKLAGELDAAQVRAVRHLVASAVDGLKPDRVSIVDERGRLLADGAQGENGLAGLGMDERQTAIEKRLKMQVEDIVASVVGQGRARVQVSAQLDANRVESRSETFDPESKVIRSSQNRTENATTSEQNGAVTVGNELPGAQQGQAQPAPRDVSAKNEEVVNYEISRTTRTEVLEGGRVKKLSVAVLVDGAYSRSPAGEVTYQPRPSEELERIGQLVRTAIGFDEGRGDKVEVVNLRFAEAPAAPIDAVEQSLVQQLLAFTKEDVVRMVEIAVIVLLTLMVLMTVVKPLLKQVLATDNSAVRQIPAFMRSGSVAIVPESTGDPASPGSPVRTLSATDTALAQMEAPSEKMLAIAQIKGQLKAQSVEKIGALVSQNPADTVAVLRGWIHEKAPA